MPTAYQFQKLRVSMRQLCDVGLKHDPKSDWCYMAHNYVFNASDAIADAKESGLTIDQSFSFELARGFQRSPLDSPTLAMIAINNQQIHVSICGKKSRVETPWLADVCGFDDYGRDFIQPCAIPFVFWNGQYCFRVHDLGAFPHESEYAVQDFGSLDGTSTSGCTKEEFERIRSNPSRYLDYSAVPHEHEIVLRKRDDHLTITQAFLELVDNKLGDHP